MTFIRSNTCDCLTGYLTFADSQQMHPVALDWPGDPTVWAWFGSRPQRLTIGLLDLGVGRTNWGLESQGQLRERSWGFAIGCLPASRKGFTIIEASWLYQCICLKDPPWQFLRRRQAHPNLHTFVPPAPPMPLVTF